METQALDFPKIDAVLRANGTGEVTINGTSHPFQAEDEATVLREALRLITDTAAQLGRPVKVTTTDPDGQGQIIVSPEGTVSEAAPVKSAPRRQKDLMPAHSDPAILDANPAPVGHAPAPVSTVSALAAAPVAEPAAPVTFASAAMRQEPTSVTETAATELATRRSQLKETTFLVSDPVVQPATQGVRGVMSRMGLRMAPSSSEIAEREDIRAVSQHWPGARTIAVVNRKGGANKTPTVAALAGVFARYGGGGVLAWDNNENQGTLGWRTEQGPHTSSVLDLLRDKERLLSPLAHNALLAHYVHHQTEDKYDVLRSDENDEGDHEIQADEVHSVHAVAAKYYRMIIMDSGNTARAANWRAMIGHTDQLVIPTTTMEDRAEAAKLTLQTLAARDEHSAMLAKNAVVIISQWKPEDGPEARRIAAGFEPLVRRVVTVPYDQALKAGKIRHSALKPATQRAWLAAAAAVAQGL